MHTHPKRLIEIFPMNTQTNVFRKIYKPELVRNIILSMDMNGHLPPLILYLPLPARGVRSLPLQTFWTQIRTDRTLVLN